MTNKKKSERRDFFKKIALTGVGLSSLPYLSIAKSQNSGKDIPENLTILFQGDSITDAGRNRGSYWRN